MVLAVGAYTTRALLGEVALHTAHGLPHLGVDGVTIFPVFHPAGILHGDSNSLSLTAFDLAQAGKWWRGEREGGDEGPEETEIVTHIDNHDDVTEIAVDTEYYPLTGEPICWSVSAQPGKAIVVWPHQTREMQLLGEWIRIKKPLIIFHNALADLPPLKRMGIDIDGWGIPWRDTMEQAYLLRHEPLGLKDLAERHLSLKMEDYASLVARHYDPPALASAASHVAAHSSITPSQTHSLKTGKPFKKPRKEKVTYADKRTKEIASALKKRDIPALTYLLALEEPSLAIVPREEVERYSARDPDATLRIYSRFTPRIDGQGLGPVEELDNAVVPMFAEMSRVGLPFDEGRYEQLRHFVQEESGRLLGTCRNLSGVSDFNPGSSDQVALWCRAEYKRSGRCKLYRKTDGGEDSTDKKALSGLIGEHPLISSILEYRTLAKLKSSYVDKLPSMLGGDVRYHPDWRLKGVETGRAAEWILTFPSRTELGRRVRSCFVAPPGYEMASFDLSQIELRITAALSQDPTMLSAYREARDLHQETVDGVFGGAKDARHAAKIVNFRMLYGGGAKSLFEGLIQEGIVNEDRSPKFSKTQCGDIISGWFDTYPGVRALIDRTTDFIRSTGYARTELGRRRYLPAIYLHGDRLDYLREEAVRQGFAHVISGTAQEVIKRAMVRVWAAITGRGGERPRLAGVLPLLQYHDELVFMGPEGVFEDAKWIIMEAMCADSERFGIPIESKMVVGKNWGSLK
jgi:DNA polymerase I-like protein with 3'-5' exonuclease and polymerase domains